MSIPYSRQVISDDDVQAVEKVLRSDFLTQGPMVENFENELSQKLNAKYAIACSSGTAALHLAYASIGINSQSLGIVPAITFAATANALAYLGCQIKFCDVDPKTGLLDPSSLEKILDNESDFEGKKIITPVSLSGKIAPLKTCKELANKYDCLVVEDGSHSPGAEDHAHGKSLSCEFSHAACLSFHPVKHICCGEGGAVFTNSEELMEACKKLRTHGIERPFGEEHETPWRYDQSSLGWNYRMNDLQAALGISQLAKLKWSLEKRRKLAQRYLDAFSESPFSEHFEIPVKSDGDAWHLYVIRFFRKGMRDQAYKFLKTQGIHSQIHYLPVYRHTYYENTLGKVRLPGAEKYFEGCLSIPLFPTLEQEKQEMVIEALNKFIRTKI